MKFNLGKTTAENMNVIKDVDDILIIGGCGTGKTTKLRNIISQIPKDNNIYVISEYNEYKDLGFQHYNVDFANFDLFRFYKNDLDKFNDLESCIGYYNTIIHSFCDTLEKLTDSAAEKINLYILKNYDGSRNVDIFTFYEWLLRNHSTDSCLHSIYLKMKLIIQNKSLVNEYIDKNKPIIFTQQDLSNKRLMLFNILSKIYSLIDNKESWIIIDCVIEDNLEMFFFLKNLFKNKKIHFILSSDEIIQFFSENFLKTIDCVEVLTLPQVPRDYIIHMFGINTYLKDIIGRNYAVLIYKDETIVLEKLK